MGVGLVNSRSSNRDLLTSGGAETSGHALYVDSYGGQDSGIVVWPQNTANVAARVERVKVRCQIYMDRGYQWENKNAMMAATSYFWRLRDTVF